MSIHERCDNCSGIDPSAFVDAFTSGFLAGHEAATRTRDITTVAELDALPVGSVVRGDYGAIYEKGEGWISTGGYRPVWYSTRGGEMFEDVDLPAHVLHEPEED